ncbi:MAG: hypothetical protein KIT46_01650 [Anaerolineales bacterium]|nr:hypothetical protein [Anaerolineales bacterium]MCW5854729.1 hypothetical protein [Anaerolineales bacterium]
MSENSEPQENEILRSSLIRPTLDTPFHIDFSWWRQNDQEWQVFLYGLLSEEQQASVGRINLDDTIDRVDPQTAQVTQIDALQYLLSSHYGANDEQGGSSLIESIFRAFLKNGNQPLTAEQLAADLGRPAQTILRTLSGRQVYRGIRPANV